MRSFISIAALTLLASLPALPQGGGPGGFGRRGPMNGPLEFGGMHIGKVVTGAPFSATVTNTVVQQLSGGGTIQRVTTGQIARDSSGRFYEQETITGGPLSQNGQPTTLIFVSDPTTGYSYMLNSAKNTAVRRALPSAKWNSGAGAAPSADGSPMRGPRANRAGAGSPDVVESDLQPDSSSGVTATGKSYSRTIPAGSIGNSQPIVSSHSTWYSPDLQIVVKAVRTDPRFGDSTYALTNIVTKEPDPSLFQVPAGYTVTDAPTHGGMRGSTRGAPPQQ